MCADIKKVKTTNSKVSDHQEDESCRLLQENARLHTNLRTREAIAKMELTAVHHSSYGPDLAAPKFHLLGHLKNALLGRRFADEDKLKHSMHKELRHFSRELYTIGRKCLTQKWKNCVVMKENLWENDLNIFEGRDHDTCKFQYNRK
jgi:hypothetical protein